MMTAPRPYMSLAQLLDVVPWSRSTVEKMIVDGTLKQGVHYYRPRIRGRSNACAHYVFKWEAIVQLIEGGAPSSEEPKSEEEPQRRRTRRPPRRTIGEPDEIEKAFDRMHG